MSSNICGNCAKFRPKPGEKFFNCTKAEQAGVKYGMQVRPDTLSCDAFEPLKPPIAPKPAPKPTKAPARARPQTGKLCPWGRLILLAAILLIILLLAWGIYTCTKNIGEGPAPTTTPTPTPTPTSTGPTPTPVSPYIELEMNQWARSSTQAVFVHSPQMSASFGGSGAAPGTAFISFSVTVTNISGQRMSVSPYAFWITDSFGTSYGAAGNPIYFAWRYNPPIIPAGGTADGTIPYQIPSYATGLKVNYVIDQAAVPAKIGRWQLPW